MKDLLISTRPSVLLQYAALLVGPQTVKHSQTITDYIISLCEYLTPALYNFNFISIPLCCFWEKNFFSSPSFLSQYFSFVFNTNTHCYQLTTHFIALINSTRRYHRRHFLSWFHFRTRWTEHCVHWKASCPDLTVWPASSLTEEKKIPACTSVTSGIAACKMILWQSFTFLSLSCSDQKSPTSQQLTELKTDTETSVCGGWERKLTQNKVKQYKLCLRSFINTEDKESLFTLFQPMRISLCSLTFLHQNYRLLL